MLKTIGIGSQMCNGKNTLSNILLPKLNYLCKEKWVENAFADKVKNIFQDAFDKDREWVEKYKRQESPPEGFSKNIRQCLIAIGDGFRQMKSNIWIESAFNRQKDHQIITDCRYVNECDYIRKLGGITILLWRPGYENNLPNASEQEYMPFVRKCLETVNWKTGDAIWKPFEGEIGAGMEIPFDLFIRNEGSIEELEEKADTIIIPFLRRKWKTLF